MCVNCDRCSHMHNEPRAEHVDSINNLIGLLWQHVTISGKMAKLALLAVDRRWPVAKVCTRPCIIHTVESLQSLSGNCTYIFFKIANVIPIDHACGQRVIHTHTHRQTHTQIHTHTDTHNTHDPSLIPRREERGYTRPMIALLISILLLS